MHDCDEAATAVPRDARAVRYSPGKPEEGTSRASAADGAVLAQKYSFENYTSVFKVLCSAEAQ